MPALDADEGHEQDGREGERGEHLRGAPAGAARRRQPPDERGQRRGHGHRAQEVEPARGAGGDAGHAGRHRPGDQTGAERDGVEDPGPAEQLGHQSAEQHSGGRARAGHRSPHPQGASASRSGREEVRHQRQGRGCHHGGAGALHGAGDDERSGGGGQSGGQ